MGLVKASAGARDRACSGTAAHGGAHHRFAGAINRVG